MPTDARMTATIGVVSGRGRPDVLCEWFYGHMSGSRARGRLRSDSAKQQLIFAGERLYALHGLDGVPLVRIGAAAGTANKSAVQYHFGSKEGLIDAIVGYRLDDLARRRAVLSARVPPGDLRGVVEAHQLPLIELAEDNECHYLTFLEQLLRNEDVYARVPSAYRRANLEYCDRVSELIANVPQRLREIRIEHTSAICLHVCADRHRAREMGLSVTPYAIHVSQLLDGVVAYLTADPSQETLTAVCGFPAVQPRARTFP